MPVLAVCDGCQAQYRLKDELAGQKVKCRTCGTVIEVPVDLDEADVAEVFVDGLDPAFQRDRFLVNQKRISISEKYYVYDDDKNPILFVERPAHLLRMIGAVLAGMFVSIFVALAFVMIGVAIENGMPQMKVLGGVVVLVGILAAIFALIAVMIWIMPKRHISIYADDTKTRLLLEVLQDRKVNFIEATYTINCPRDGRLGHLRKNYLYNFLRKRWHVFGSDGRLLTVAKEDSLILSLLRRFIGPLFGLLRTNFVMLRPGTETVIGEFNRRLTLFDRYVLDLTSDHKRELDRRMAVALGILLDTGERR